MDSSRYQQWKQSWLVYGRVLLTLTVLVLITVSLYFAANSFTDDGEQPIHERIIRERRWSSQRSVHDPTNLFMVTVQQHTATAMSSSDETKTTSLYAKRVARSSVDKLSIATDKSDKISMSNQHDKYHSVNGSARDATTTAAVSIDSNNSHINTNTSSQTVKGDTNPTIHKNDKHKKKSKRKKFQSISGIDVKSVIPNIDNNNNSNKKNSDGEVLANHISTWNDQFSATDVFDSQLDQRKIRNKKDQLIIREDTGVVVVHKVCVPCKIVPGQPSRHPPRKPSRQRPRSMFKCNYT